MPKTKKKVLSNLSKKVARKKKTVETPVWKGPEVDGVTQSLLSRFLVCKERFRLLVIEGWQPDEGFSAPLEYGQMWHACEEALAAKEDWEEYLKNYCVELCRKYPTEQNQVDKWYNVCKKQFPVFIEFWSKHKDVKRRTPLLQEQVFKVPYNLPSGRKVLLRGKWDSVDRIGKDVWLQENKTKGRIEEDYLTRQLTFDLQTMIYLIALLVSDELDNADRSKVKGVRYNVIRRPLSGGKGSIKQKKGSKNVPPETKEEFYNRLQEYFVDEPSYWFMRWNVEITRSDVMKFKKDFLDPCLEELCDWYQLQTTGITAGTSVHHYRLPYGIFNPIAEGRGSDLEEYLLSGSTVGLKRVESLFGELE